MVDHQERLVSVRDGRLQIAVLEGGSGEPLVYIHGAGGLPGWSPYLDRLAQEFKVYAPYHPGVGPSTGLEHLDELWDLVLFYEELLDALGLQHIRLVGHCYGGMVAAELAAQCPLRIHRLALIGAWGLWLDHTPVADLFVLSPEERARALWYDPTSEAAKAGLAQPENPQAPGRGRPGQHQNPGVHRQILLAHPRTRVEKADPSHHCANPLALGGGGWNRAPGLWRRVPSPGRRLPSTGARPVWALSPAGVPRSVLFSPISVLQGRVASPFL